MLGSMAGVIGQTFRISALQMTWLTFLKFKEFLFCVHTADTGGKTFYFSKVRQQGRAVKSAQLQSWLVTLRLTSQSTSSPYLQVITVVVVCCTGCATKVFFVQNYCFSPVKKRFFSWKTKLKSSDNNLSINLRHVISLMTELSLFQMAGTFLMVTFSNTFTLINFCRWMSYRVIKKILTQNYDILKWDPLNSGDQ